MNNKMMQGMLLELWMVTVFRGDGVIVGSLELGLSQHQPCMPREIARVGWIDSQSWLE